jgi:drug/metabolite transporter (DMT)-like permease
MALASALLFGLNASTSKIIMSQGFTPAQIVLFRSLVTALIAGTIVAFKNPSAFRVKRNEILVLVSFGIFGVALMQWAYSSAVRALPVGIALLIEYTSIVIVPLASWLLFRQRVSKQIWLGVVLVLGGLAVVSKIWNSSLNAVGVGYAFLAAIFLSVYFIMGERIQRGRDTMSTLFYTMLIAGLFWLICGNWWSTATPALDNVVSLSQNLESVRLPVWLLLLWLGVMGTFLPMLLSYRALYHLNAAGVGIASTAETVFAFFFGWLWLRETFDSLQLIGVVLVIAGIVIAQLAKSRKRAIE